LTFKFSVLAAHEAKEKMEMATKEGVFGGFYVSFSPTQILLAFLHKSERSFKIRRSQVSSLLWRKSMSTISER